MNSNKREGEQREWKTVVSSKHQKFFLFLFLSWQLLGPSALTSVAVFLFLLPLNFVISKKRSQFQVRFAS